MSLSGGCKVKGLSGVRRLNYFFILPEKLLKNKEEKQEPDYSFSLFYISHKWWEV
jgi:hypothetical protein